LKRKLVVPIAGFSYNPRKDDHQDAIAEALALEIEKRDKEDAEKRNKFITNSSTTIDYYDNDEDNDEDDDDEGNINGYSNPKSKPKNRAQRNKERTKKMLEYEKSKEKLELEVLQEVEKIPLLLKQIEKEERDKALKKALKENNKQQSTSSLNYEEAGLIPLTDELNGSLRRIKPKGAGIKIRVNDMKTNGDLVTVAKRKRYSLFLISLMSSITNLITIITITRHAYEKPRADRNVVWTPKYKYV